MLQKLLLVDDDKYLRSSLVEQLELSKEFQPKGVSTAKEGLEIIKFESFDVILLNSSLPDMNGFKACNLFRRNGARCPIIMLMETKTTSNLKFSFDVGANDYVNKPFRMRNLMPRIRNLLQQQNEKFDTVIPVGPFTFRPNSKLLINPENDQMIYLTEKETMILEFLFQAGDEVVGRNKLLGEVWGYNVGVTTHTLETHIYRLRQKIEVDPSNAQILVTQPGGYRLLNSNNR